MGGTNAYDSDPKADSQPHGSRFGQARAANIQTRTQNTRLKLPDYEGSLSDLSSYNTHIDPYQLNEHSRT